MTAVHPAALDSTVLARRLRDLVGDERRVQIAFLLHLDEFDRRQAFLQAGFGSLWDYCLKALHLREGAAGRRIGAMRVLRRFPALETPLRDGRLCLSTVSLLGQVLTDDNLEDLVARAAFLTKSDVEHLVVSLRPRTAPREGIRRLPVVASSDELAAAASASRPSTSAPIAPSLPSSPPCTSVADAPGGPTSRPETHPAPERDADVEGAGGQRATAADETGRGVSPPPDVEDASRERRAEVQAVSRDRWSLRVTLDAALKKDLDDLTTLLSHKIPTGDLAEVLREAVQCAIDKHGKRRGTVAPQRARMPRQSPRSAELATRDEVDPSPRSSSESRTIPAAVRRQVWDRDGGRCTFEGENGRRCDSRWQLELDHIEPAARGGSSTVENLRLRCRKHNLLYAEEVYGCAHMARFRRHVSAFAPPRLGSN